MSWRRFSISLMLFAFLLVSGCGGEVVDQGRVEAAAESTVEDVLNIRIGPVDCPSDVNAEKGTKFECTASAIGAGDLALALRVINADADVELLDVTQR